MLMSVFPRRARTAANVKQVLSPTPAPVLVDGRELTVTVSVLCAT